MALVGKLVWCGDPACDCWIPMILDGVEEVWRGTFLEHPSEGQKEELRDELALECARRGVVIGEDSTWDPGGL